MTVSYKEQGETWLNYIAITVQLKTKTHIKIKSIHS